MTTCKNCGNEFDPERSMDGGPARGKDRRYCIPECRYDSIKEAAKVFGKASRVAKKAAWRKTWICRQCGGKWNDTVITKRALFCSSDCEKEFKKLPAPHCCICGEEFLRNSPSQKTCGDSCRSELQRQAGRRSEEKHAEDIKRRAVAAAEISRSQRKAESLKFKCAHCLGSWPIGRHYIRGTKFCSRRCARASQVSAPGYRERLREQDRKNRAKYTERRRIARQTNVQIRLRRVLRNRVSAILKARNVSHSSGIKLLGCSIDAFKAHIESKFSKRMTWENRGKVWELDHIHPCASFDLSDIRQVQICFHWTNFQPLLKAINRAKGAKILEPQISLLLPAQEPSRSDQASAA